MSGCLQLDVSPSSSTALAAIVSRLERLYYGTALADDARPHVAALLDLRAAGWQRNSSVP